MKRDEYLTICKEVSMIKETGLYGIKINLNDSMKVSLNGIIYYPIAYQLSWINGHIQHTAILHDLKNNSTIQCKLEQVEGFDCGRK